MRTLFHVDFIMFISFLFSKIDAGRSLLKRRIYDTIVFDLKIACLLDLKLNRCFNDELFHSWIKQMNFLKYLWFLKFRSICHSTQAIAFISPFISFLSYLHCWLMKYWSSNWFIKKLRWKMLEWRPSHGAINLSWFDGFPSAVGFLDLCEMFSRMFSNCAIGSLSHVHWCIWLLCSGTGYIQRGYCFPSILCHVHNSDYYCKCNNV